MSQNMRASDLKLFLSFAQRLADVSGPAVLKHFRKPIPIQNKATGGDFDPVTRADKAAEKAISDLLKVTFPDHGIIGEEFGTRNSDSAFQWVIDPIDGTRAYIMGSPMWGTLIGLLYEGKPVLGVMDQPFTGERLWSNGSGTYYSLRGNAPKRVKTRLCDKLEDATFTTTHPDLFVGPKQQKVLHELKSKVRMSRFGGDCYLYALLAQGFADLIIEAGLKIYDIAPLIPIIEGAGGRVTTWTGGSATNGGNVITSGDARLHDQALKILALG